MEKLTDGEIRLAPGTMYGSLSKMEKDGLISFLREEEKRKIYQITELGTEVLQLELPEGLSLARRGLWNGESDPWIDGAGRLWGILTEG